MSNDRAARTAREYWRRNLRYLGALLTVWFLVSFGAGILFADRLNEVRIPGTGFPLGFWFAQQGSIYAFVVLIFVYVFLMNRLDRELDVDERDDPSRRSRPAADRPGGRRSAADRPGRGRGATDPSATDRTGGPS